MNIDRALIAGRITMPLELRRDDSGLSITSLPIAVNKRSKRPDGGFDDHPLFVDVTVFGKTAEHAVQRLGVGSEVVVEAHHQNKPVTTPDGRNIKVLRLVADNVHWTKGTRKEVSNG